MLDVDTKLNEKFEITGYTPDYNRSILAVMAFDLDTQKEDNHEISFKDIALAYYPDGNGKVINVSVHYNGFDKDTGPYTEPYDLPMKPASFISEILDNATDFTLNKDDRAQYQLVFDNVLANILESMQHANNG